MLRMNLYEIFRWMLMKQRITKNQKLDLMEGSATSKAEEEAAHRVRTRYVGALATS
jgi:hypothetical protein